MLNQLLVYGNFGPDRVTKSNNVSGGALTALPLTAWPCRGDNNRPDETGVVRAYAGVRRAVGVTVFDSSPGARAEALPKRAGGAECGSVRVQFIDGKRYLL